MNAWCPGIVKLFWMAQSWFTNGFSESAPGRLSRSVLDRLSIPARGHLCVLAIDASISMNKRDWYPSRIEAAKDAARTYVQRLVSDGVDAKVAVIAYGSKAKLVCKPTSIENSDRIVSGIDRIDTRGNTNITAAIKIAQQLCAGYPDGSDVVVLSDGCHNKGPRPWETAHSLHRIAVISTVGIGLRESVDEGTLKDIASSRSDGTRRYRWIGDPESLKKHFNDLAGGICRS